MQASMLCDMTCGKGPMARYCRRPLEAEGGFQPTALFYGCTEMNSVTSLSEFENRSITRQWQKENLDLEKKPQTFWDCKMWDSCCSNMRKALENSKESRLSSCWENSKKIRDLLVLHRGVTKPPVPSPCTCTAMCLILSPSTACQAGPSARCHRGLAASGLIPVWLPAVPRNIRCVSPGSVRSARHLLVPSPSGVWRKPVHLTAE